MSRFSTTCFLYDINKFIIVISMFRVGHFKRLCVETKLQFLFSRVWEHAPNMTKLHLAWLLFDKIRKIQKIIGNFRKCSVIRFHRLLSLIVKGSDWHSETAEINGNGRKWAEIIYRVDSWNYGILGPWCQNSIFHYELYLSNVMHFNKLMACCKIIHCNHLHGMFYYATWYILMIKLDNYICQHASLYHACCFMLHATFYLSSVCHTCCFMLHDIFHRCIMIAASY